VPEKIEIPARLPADFPARCPDQSGSLSLRSARLIGSLSLRSARSDWSVRLAGKTRLLQASGYNNYMGLKGLRVVEGVGNGYGGLIGSIFRFRDQPRSREFFWTNRRHSKFRWRDFDLALGKMSLTETSLALLADSGLILKPAAGGINFFEAGNVTESQPTVFSSRHGSDKNLSCS